MKVLLVVSSSTRAGTERHVVELGAGLRAAGVEAEVVCEGGGDGLDATLERRDVPVHRLELTGKGVARSVVALARLALRFDVVHTHLTHATAAAVAAKAITGRPLVETRHFLTLAYERRGTAGRPVGHTPRRFLDRHLDPALAPSPARAPPVPRAPAGRRP